MGGSTISTSETKAEALQLQSSAQGVTIPVVHGTARVPGNLLDYLDFKSISHTTTQSSGGKGGGVKQKNTTYTYTVSLIMGLADVKVVSVPRIWRGKEVYTSPAAIGATLLQGDLGQATWTPLTYIYGGTHAEGYSGLACIAAENYNLGASAQVENHNFEIVTESAYQYNGSPDADPKDVVTTWVTDTKSCVGADASWLGDLSTYSDYCRCAGLMLSPALTEQADASERLRDLADFTNSMIVLADEQIHMVPRGDEPLTGVGISYTPDLTPIYDLTPDQFLFSEGENPVRVKRKTPADAFNTVKVEYLDRANEYNTAIAQASDQASVDLYGQRPAQTLSVHWASNAQTAQLIAQLWLKRYQYILNTYEFRLPWNFASLLPSNIVTLTDPDEGLDRTPVRITSISEDDNGYLFEAEDFPHSVSSHSLYELPVSDGYTHDYNVAPGSVAAPMFIEPPVELTTTGLEVWVAVTGTSANWGGCEVWASYDGTNYKQLGTVYGGARYGVLSSSLAAGSGATAQVLLAGNGGQLLSGSATDAANLATLCTVRSAGAAPEFMAYQTATLTGTNAYDLTGLVRGAYDSVTGAQPSAAQFARIDDAIVKGEPLQPSMIGQLIRFKFVSFNIFGGGTEDISTVPEYTYTVRGDMALLPPANVSNFVVSTQADGTRQFTWGWGTATKPADLKGYVLRYLQGTGPFTWDQLQPFDTDDGFHTASPLESNLLLAGPYVFAIKTVDNFGVLSKDALFIDATLPDPRLGNAIEYVDYHQAGWPGTLTHCQISRESGDSVLVASDQTTWATLPSTWSAWTRWNWDPYPSFTYETASIDFGAAVAVLPVASYIVDGQVTAFEVSTSPDGTTWSSWAAVAGSVTTQHIKTRLSVAIPTGSSTGPGVTPISVLRRFTVAYIGKVTSEAGNDEDISTYTGVHRIAAGDVRLPTSKNWVHISRVSVTLQNVSGGWSWTLIDKNLTDGPRVRIYNGATLADPPLIDWMIEGIPA